MSLLELVTGAHSKVLRPSGGCHTCPRKRVDFVPATLAQGPVLFLGEAPGETEVEKQEGFTGASGSLLRQVAREESVPGPWSFSNTIHCRPPANAAPKPKEVSCCLAQFTLEEIRGYSMVVLVGSVPLQALFPGAKADHFRGNVAHHPDFPGQRFYAIYHPAYILRRPDLKDQFRRQINRLARVVAGEPPAVWHTVSGTAGLEELRRMVSAPLLSVDFETNRLESWSADGRIKSLAVTADGKTVVTAHEDDPAFRPMLELLGKYVEDPQHSAVGNNIGFDLEWLEREQGVTVRCQLLHELQVVWYYAGQYKMATLKELVARELDGYRYLLHNPHEVRDPDLLQMYNAEDVVHPLKLLKIGMARLGPKTRDLAVRVLGPVSLVLRRMTATGFHLRQEYRQQKIEEYTEKRRTVVQSWKAEDPEFIPDTHESGDGLLKYLFEIRKLPVLQRTEESDQPSTDKSVLKQLVRDGHAIVQHLLDLREIDKLQSTYLEGYDKHLWPDERVRSSFPLTWTDSGRTSSRSPNVQNIPRKKEIRDLFGVPAGAALIESDFSQIEFRIMVCLAHDTNGIQGYLRGEDAHTMTARSVTGASTPTKEQRTLAKPINFGFLYGGSEFMVQGYVADEYGVIWTIEQAAGYRDTFMKTYPGIPIFHSDSQSRLEASKGWFESVLGHVFHYTDWSHPDKQRRDHARRAALNAEAQGPAAQICFYTKVLGRRLLDERGFDSVQYVNTVHDSILTECPDPRWVPDVVATLEEAKAQVYDWVKPWFVVPLVMEHSSGESWGSLKEVKHG